VPVVLYLRGLCHLHLSTGSPEDKLPRNKNTEKIICLPAARAVNAEQKDHLAFLLTRGKGEQRTAMRRSERARRKSESDRARRGRGRGRGKEETAPARREKSAEVRQKWTREEMEGARQERRRGEEASPGPKAAKEPLKKTA